MKKLSTEEFKEKFIKKFGNIYNLDKVNYINNKTPVTVTCPIHGDFEKRPDLLLDGCKCPKCSMTSITSEDEFIEKAMFVHNGFFSYVPNTFKNVSSKVSIICPIHGIWHQKGNNHLQGQGCPQCKKEGIKHEISKLQTNSKSSKKYNTEEFIKKAVLKHGNKFSYEKTDYINNKTEVIVTCSKHGDFKITPNHLLTGRGCPKCSGNYHQTTEEVINQFRIVHGDKYDYSKVDYVRTHDNIVVTCKRHGDFFIAPSNHLKGEGCPKCKSSAIEMEVMKLLDKNGIEYKHCVRNLPFMNGLELDFFIEKYMTAIECQGIQHFFPVDFFGGKAYLDNVIKNDTIKKELCESNGIKLLYFSNLKIEYPYTVLTDTSELLNQITQKK